MLSEHSEKVILILDGYDESGHIPEINKKMIDDVIQRKREILFYEK